MTDSPFKVNNDLRPVPRDPPYSKRNVRLSHNENRRDDCRRIVCSRHSGNSLKNPVIALVRIGALSYTLLPKGLSVVHSLTIVPFHSPLPTTVSTLHVIRIPVTKSCCDLVFWTTDQRPSIAANQRPTLINRYFRHNRTIWKNSYNRYTLTTDDTTGSPSSTSGVRPDFTIKTSPRRGTQ